MSQGQCRKCGEPGGRYDGRCYGCVNVYLTQARAKWKLTRAERYLDDAAELLEETERTAEIEAASDLTRIMAEVQGAHRLLRERMN